MPGKGDRNRTANKPRFDKNYNNIFKKAKLNEKNTMHNRDRNIVGTLNRTMADL